VLLAAAKPLAPSQPKLAGAAAATGVEWTGSLHCDARVMSHDMREEFTERVLVRFEDGAFFVVRRPPRSGGHLELRGKPSDDGTLVLTGGVIVPRGRMEGQEVPVRLEGRLDAGRYRAEGYMGNRSCSLELARR
jgi:hypothetical protein